MSGLDFTASPGPSSRAAVHAQDKLARHTTDTHALMGLFTAYDSSVTNSELRLVGGRISSSSNPYGRRITGAARAGAGTGMRGYTASSSKSLARPQAAKGSARKNRRKKTAVSECERFMAAEADTSLSDAHIGANVRIL